MRRVLIIEDEVGVQMTLEDRLIAEGYSVEIKGDGVSGEEEALANSYDIILLDIMLPGRDGYKVCENIRGNGITTPIIMLTARNSDLDTVLGLRQGADDYVPKPFDMGVLLARIEAVLRRGNSSLSLNNGQISFGDFILDRDKGRLEYKGEDILLNALEYKLLDYLTQNSGRVIDRNTLLDSVWGYDSESTSRTVDVHIAKLRHKLKESHIPKHIITVRGRGYKFIL